MTVSIGEAVAEQDVDSDELDSDELDSDVSDDPESSDYELLGSDELGSDSDLQLQKACKRETLLYCIIFRQYVY